MAGIGVGLIGTGFMGKCHALAWGAVRRVFGDVPAAAAGAGLRHAARARARRWRTQFGFARATDDWRALVADAEVEVVSITTPNRFHREMALAAIGGGQACLVREAAGADAGGGRGDGGGGGGGGGARPWSATTT